MRWRALVVAATAAVLVLVSAGPALAKGADRATISGPGLTGPIVVDDGGAAGGEPGSGGKLATLGDATGLFLAMFGPGGGPGLVDQQPAGALGPRYELAYRVPDGSPSPATVTQDLYPGAAGGPVVYTRAGQQVFGATTTGGWYRAPASLAALLSTLGVPGVATVPATPTAGASRSLPPSARADGASARGGSRPAGFWVAIAAAVLVACAVALTVGYRRRVRTAGPGTAAR